MTDQSLRVLIDGYFLGKPYGFGRYVQTLCNEMAKVDPEEVGIWVAVPDRAQARSVPIGGALRSVVLKDASFVLWEQIIIPRLARRLGCDVIHSPYNSAPIYSGRIARVVTIHDTMFLEKRDDGDVEKRGLRERAKIALVGMYSRWAFHLGAKHSTLVTVSDTSRAALRNYGADAHTVYNSVDGFVAQHAPGRKPAHAVRYVLHRGGYGWNRNTARVIEAFSMVRARCPELELVIIGVPGGGQRFGVNDPAVHFKPWMSDLEVADFYAGAACVVATSLREGFCLPIIEAFGLGAPVVTSNLDPMREIAGGAAVLVDPLSAEQIAEAVIEIVSKPTVAASLIECGRTRFGNFSGAEATRRLLAIYKAAASRR